MLTVDFQLLNLEPGQHVLDMGCGSGRHMSAIIERPRTIAVGADGDFETLKEVRARLDFHDQIGWSAKNSKWSLAQHDITALPYPNEIFDWVICSEVLEHIQNEKKALQELFRVIKPNGGIVVSVPHSFPERVCWVLSKSYTKTKGGHVRIYKKGVIQSRLADLGLIITGSHRAHSLHTPYWWLKCVVGIENDQFFLIRLYHRFLTWDIMRKPIITRFLDRLLNPVMGKSLVIYCRKPDG